MRKKLLMAFLLVAMFALSGCELFGGPSEHVHALTKVDAIAPSCTLEGTKEHYICNECKKLFSDSEAKEEITDLSSLVVNKTEHTFSEWTIVEGHKVVDCESGVKYQRVCSVCTFTETKEDPANHNYSDWTVVKDAKCGEKGEKERTCSLCNHVEKEEIEAIEHTYSDWTVTKDAKCGEKGEKERTCSLCNNTEKEEIEALEHIYSDWTVTKEAKCGEKGEKERTCSLCNNTEKEEIAAIEHSFESGSVICDLCGEYVTKYPQFEDLIDSILTGDKTIKIQMSELGVDVTAYIKTTEELEMVIKVINKNNVYDIPCEGTLVYKDNNFYLINNDFIGAYIEYDNEIYDDVDAANLTQFAEVFDAEESLERSPVLKTLFDALSKMNEVKDFFDNNPELKEMIYTALNFALDSLFVQAEDEDALITYQFSIDKIKQIVDKLYTKKISELVKYDVLVGYIVTLVDTKIETIYNVIKEKGITLEKIEEVIVSLLGVDATELNLTEMYESIKDKTLGEFIISMQEPETEMTVADIKKAIMDFANEIKDLTVFEIIANLSSYEGDLAEIKKTIDDVLEFNKNNIVFNFNMNADTTFNSLTYSLNTEDVVMSFEFTNGINEEEYNEAIKAYNDIYSEENINNLLAFMASQLKEDEEITYNAETDTYSRTLSYYFRTDYLDEECHYAYYNLDITSEFKLDYRNIRIVSFCDNIYICYYKITYDEKTTKMEFSNIEFHKFNTPVETTQELIDLFNNSNIDKDVSYLAEYPTDPYYYDSANNTVANIDEIDHVWVEKEDKVIPTDDCSTPECHLYECSTCGTLRIVEYTYHHNYEHHATFNGLTCYDGYTIHSVCKKCGDELQEERNYCSEMNYRFIEPTYNTECYVTMCKCLNSAFVYFGNRYDNIILFNNAEKIYQLDDSLLRITLSVKDVQDCLGTAVVTIYYGYDAEKKTYQSMYEKEIDFALSHNFEFVSEENVDGIFFATYQCSECGKTKTVEYAGMSDKEYHIFTINNQYVVVKETYDPIQSYISDYDPIDFIFDEEIFGTTYLINEMPVFFGCILTKNGCDYIHEFVFIENFEMNRETKEYTGTVIKTPIVVQQENHLFEYNSNFDLEHPENTQLTCAICGDKVYVKPLDVYNVYFQLLEFVFTEDIKIVVYKNYYYNDINFIYENWVDENVTYFDDYGYVSYNEVSDGTIYGYIVDDIIDDEGNEIGICGIKLLLGIDADGNLQVVSSKRTELLY